MAILRAAGNAPGKRVLWAKQVAEVGAKVWKDISLQQLMEVKLEKSLENRRLRNRNFILKIKLP